MTGTLDPATVAGEAPALAREQARNRRRREVRARTVSTKRMPKGELAAGAALYPERPGVDYERPATRADCEGAPRPCPFVSCVHHLYLDVNRRTGAIKLNFPDLEAEDLKESCALDVADRGGANLEEVGAHLNLTRERVRQLEVVALPALRRHFERLGGPAALLDDVAPPPRRTGAPAAPTPPAFSRPFARPFAAGEARGFHARARHAA